MAFGGRARSIQQADTFILRQQFGWMNSSSVLQHQRMRVAVLAGKMRIKWGLAGKLAAAVALLENNSSGRPPSDVSKKMIEGQLGTGRA